VRFGALDGELVAGRSVPGRGAYTCPRLVCFERASAHRGVRAGAAPDRPGRSDPRTSLHWGAEWL